MLDLIDAASDAAVLLFCALVILNAALLMTWRRRGRR